MRKQRFGHGSPNPSLERDPSYERERREYREFNNDRERGIKRYGSQYSTSSRRSQRRDRAWMDDRNWGRAPDADYGSGMNYSDHDPLWRDGSLQNSDYGREENNKHKSGGFMDSVKSFFGVGPKGYKRSDERIKEEASEALARDPRVDASEVELDVVEGFITLKGTVPNRMMKRQAEICVEDISGVQDVHNLLRVSTAHLGTATEMGSATKADTDRPRI